MPDRAAARGRDGVQVRSLTHRNRFAEAIGLAWSRCASSASPSRPRTGSPPSSTTSSSYLYRWLDHTDAADDLARPEITDPTLLAATRLINAILPAAYFAGDLAMYAWLSLEALRIWLEHGPAAPCSARRATPPSPPWRCAATTPPGTGRCGGSWRWARPAATSPSTSQARFLFALTGLLVRADRERCPRGSAGPGGADRRRRPGQRRLHLPPDRVLPAGLRALAGRLRRRGGGGAGLRAPYRQRADRPVARQLPVAGRCAARRKLRRSG